MRLSNRTAAAAFGLVLLTGSFAAAVQDDKRATDASSRALPEATPIEVEIVSIGNMKERWYDDSSGHQHGSALSFSNQGDLPHNVRVLIGPGAKIGTDTTLNFWRDGQGALKAEAVCRWARDSSVNSEPPPSGILADLRGKILLDCDPFVSPGLLRCQFMLTGTNRHDNNRISVMGGFQIVPADTGPR